MHEIEAKILEIDHDGVVRTLLSMGARLDFDGPLRALYYDDAARTLESRGDCLRVRLEARRATITHKEFVSDEGAKTRDELEITVSDFDTARAILRRLGFSPWIEIRKHRWSYSLGATHVVLDRHEGEHAHVPELLEIEAPSLSEMESMAQDLGFVAADLKPWTAVEVFDHYRQAEPHQPF